MRGTWRCEAGREGDDVGKEVTVCEADTESIRGAVGEAFDGDASWINGVATERVRKRGIEKGDISAKAAADDVPGVLPRLRRKNDEVKVVGQVEKGCETLLGGTSGAVERYDQG